MPSTSPGTSVVRLATSYLKFKVQLMAASCQEGFIDELFSAVVAYSERKHLAGDRRPWWQLLIIMLISKNTYQS
jgi:hypothetical protein